MFENLPDSSRVWVFAASRALDAADQRQVLSRLAPFIAAWTSHGRPVPAEAAIVSNRLLVVAAHIEDGPNAGVSGCGIDALTRAVEQSVASMAVEWLDGMQILYRDPAGEMRAVPRPDFRGLVHEGAVDGATHVVDTTVADLGSLREQGLERPLESSWHGRVFRIGAAA
jgi:hypothetical protein